MALIYHQEKYCRLSWRMGWFRQLAALDVSGAAGWLV